ncbi:unnamed protein product [Strongylus vulgaris]|uniref:Uncharacterized protein n=1 Tax=Strongylus vulgaris TaxID=40348 RepID=A0A3P7KBB7_STRVU|nr:unnamed protein product [Strongylus vulgaris]
MLKDLRHSRTCVASAERAKFDVRKLLSSATFKTGAAGLLVAEVPDEPLLSTRAGDVIINDVYVFNII